MGADSVAMVASYGTSCCSQLVAIYGMRSRSRICTLKPKAAGRSEGDARDRLLSMGRVPMMKGHRLWDGCDWACGRKVASYGIVPGLPTGRHLWEAACLSRGAFGYHLWDLGRRLRPWPGMADAPSGRTNGRYPPITVWSGPVGQGGWAPRRPSGAVFPGEAARGCAERSLFMGRLPLP